MELGARQAQWLLEGDRAQPLPLSGQVAGFGLDPHLEILFERGDLDSE